MINKPTNYKWGISYFNRKDDRIVVPERVRWMGLTLNFCNIYSYWLILGIISFGLIFGWLSIYNTETRARMGF